MKKILCWLGIHDWRRYGELTDGTAAIFQDRCERCYLARQYWIGKNDLTKVTP